jgi:hypothetical protein
MHAAENCLSHIPEILQAFVGCKKKELERIERWEEEEEGP